MKVGDTVMFTDEESRYVQWFYGKIGVVERIGVTRASSCRVRWTALVPYHENLSAYSDFPSNSFTILVSNA